MGIDALTLPSVRTEGQGAQKKSSTSPDTQIVMWEHQGHKQIPKPHGRGRNQLAKVLESDTTKTNLKPRFSICQYVLKQVI